MPDPITAVVGLGSVGSGVANIIGSRSAANTQQEAARLATMAQLQMQEKGIDLFQQMFGVGRDVLQPFIDRGSGVLDELIGRLPELTSEVPIPEMDLETLRATPGYNFAFEQGMRGVTNSNLLRGLSGAQLKGASSFATGLADNTYKTQFDIAQKQFEDQQTNRERAFNRLFQTADIGRTSAIPLATSAIGAGSSLLGNTQQVGQSIGSNIIGAGNAGAAADIAMGSNVANMFGSIPSAFMLNRLYGQQGGQQGGPAPSAAPSTGMYSGVNDPTRYGTLY